MEMEIHEQEDMVVRSQYSGLSSGQGNYSYSYSHIFQFEEGFDQRITQHWVQEHWVSLCAWAGTLYVVMVFAGQAWMSSRSAFQIRGPLAAWSTFLAVFSILGFCRTVPEFIHILREGGIYRSVCDPSFVDSNKVSAYWTWLFTLSKMPELGDTVFIVLRKQQLIFLHWYHHLTVLIYVFYCFSEFTSCARWFMVMNYFVHSIMYSYYALRAMRIRAPRWVSMSITSLQLIQMVVGCTINYLAWQYKQTGRECNVSTNNLMYGSLMYVSYFVLFARFFHNAYFTKKDKNQKLNESDKMLNQTPENKEILPKPHDYANGHTLSDPFVNVTCNGKSTQPLINTTQKYEEVRQINGHLASTNHSTGSPTTEETKKSI